MQTRGGRERERQTEMEKRRVFEVALCLAGRSEGRRLLAGGTKVKSRREKESEKKRCAESEGGIKKGAFSLNKDRGEGDSSEWVKSQNVGALQQYAAMNNLLAHPQILLR